MAEAQKSVVYMVGPSLKTQGGISSVLITYQRNMGKRFHLRFISSYSGDIRIKDFIYFAAAVARTFFLCLSGKDLVFHIHSSTGGSYIRKSILARISMFFGKKTIFHIHGADFDDYIESASPAEKKRIIRLLNKTDRVVVLSNSWSAYFSQYIPQNKLAVIYNPSEKISTGYKAKNNPTVKILFMGRMGERKGTYDLLEAVRRLKRRDFQLHLYGDGKVNEIKRLVKAGGLEEIVRVNGWVSHEKVFELYDGADILVLPSYAEGLPMSVIEAIGRGLPVISTCVGGIPEAVLEGANGFLVKPGDVNELAKKLEILVGDRQMRERMGKRSLEIAREKFSPQVIEEQLESIYR